MSASMDSTVEVREGEELNADALEPYLRDALGIHDGAFEIRQFPGGHSNLTYLVRMGRREWVLRRPPYGSKVKSAHDMGREYTILSHIHDVYEPAPEPFLYCEDESVLGAKFYVMERIEGIILRQEAPEGFHPDEEMVRRTCESLAENLARLHAVDWRAAGLESLQRKEGSFIQRQVEGWHKRYHGSQTDDIPLVDEVYRWCHDHMPEDVGAVIIHNDYKFDNIILDADDISRVVGVLDWEMSTIGDPLFDLGVALGYWVNPDEPEGITTSRSFFTRLPGAITRERFAEVYGERSGLDVSNIHFYYVFALIKLAVVLQQIYYRYHEGLTDDERFAPMIHAVRLLAERAGEYVDKGRM